MIQKERTWKLWQLKKVERKFENQGTRRFQGLTEGTMNITRRYVHDIARGSNLDLLVRGFHGVANRLVDALQAIALALSTPQDNSQQVQAQIDKATAELKSSTNALDAAVKANQPEQ